MKWWLALVFLAGCGRTIYTPFTGDPTAVLPGDAAGRPGRSEFCAADAQGHYAFDKTVLVDNRWDGEVAIARGGGCVKRSLRDTWAVLHERETLHWVDSELQDFVRLADDRAPFVFQTKYKAGPGIFAQKWTMQWFHSASEGRVFIRYKKTEGTSYIPRWDGTIELVAVTPTVTGFAMRNEIQAARTGLEESANTIRDQLARVRRFAPNYDFLDAAETDR